MKKQTMVFFYLLANSILGYTQKVDLSKVNFSLGSTINSLNLVNNNYTQMHNPFKANLDFKINPNPQKTLQLSVINSTADYLNILSMGGDVSGSFLFASADASIDYYRQQSNSSSSTRLFFGGNFIYGDETFNDISLNTDAQKAIKRSAREFVNEYGDLYVSHAQLAKRLFVFLDISNQSGVDISKINGNLSSGFDLDLFSASVDFNVRKSLTTAYKNGNLRISIYSFGLFDDNLLASITSDLASQKDKQDFDLLDRLSNRFFTLLANNPKDPKDPARDLISYFHEKVSFSQFNELVQRHYYDNQHIKFENFIGLNNGTQQIQNLKSGLNIFTSLEWSKLLPQDVVNNLKNNLDKCDELIISNKEVIAQCSNSDCNDIATCCILPKSLKDKFANASAFSQTMFKNYPGIPSYFKGFDISDPGLYTTPTQIDGLNSWTLDYKNKNDIDIPSFFSGTFKELESRDVEVDVHFSGAINCGPNNSAAMQNKCSFSAILYDYSSNKEIESLSLTNKALSFVQIDGNYFALKGEFKLKNPNDFIKLKNIGIKIKINQTAKDDVVSKIGQIIGVAYHTPPIPSSCIGCFYPYMPEPIAGLRFTVR